MSEAESEVKRHYVIFRLGEEAYALDVVNAREIVEVTTFTLIPNAPAWIRGVVNLRGSVAPVIDLKLKLNIGKTATTPGSCVLIVEFATKGDEYVVGLMADRVLDVLELADTAIEAPPKFGARFSRGYLRGLGRRGDLLFMILDARNVFSDVPADLSSTSPPAAEGESRCVPGQLADGG
jgi:purine-binding chemotaxis protein CheW